MPIAALVGANLLLALGPWFVRMADVGPLAAGFWRLAIAAPLLLVLAGLVERRAFAPARMLWPVIGLSALAFAADLGAWHLGILRTTLANATLFGNSASFLYPIYGFVIARKWPDRWQSAALSLAALGTALLLGQSAELGARNLAGDLFCIASGLFYALYFIGMSRVRERMAPLPALGLSSLVSAPPLLLLAFWWGEVILPRDWTPVVILALSSQVLGQGLMIYALGKLTPMLVGLALLLQPVVAATIGWIVYGEALSAPEFLGAGLIAAALVLVRRGGSKAELAPVAGETRSRAGR